MNVGRPLCKTYCLGLFRNDKPRWAAGSMARDKLPTLGHISFADLKAAYAEQVRRLLDGGVDR
jgi:5-methyltetrahydrofolate--homocysteine methyltransferase